MFYKVFIFEILTLQKGERIIINRISTQAYRVLIE